MAIRYLHDLRDLAVGDVAARLWQVAAWILADNHKMKRAAGDPTAPRIAIAKDQAFTLSLRALAMVILTTLSASFLNCSPVEGLRTIRSGRSRQ